MSAALSMAGVIIISALLLTGLWLHEDIYSALTAGAGKGLRLMLDILPALMIIFPAVYVFRASGLPDRLAELLEPLLSRLSIPADCALLMLLRPVSGSAALALGADIISRCGADSLTGRTAAVMLGSSETTFYVLAVYFGAAGIKNSRWAVPAALAADLGCFLSAAWICNIFWGA